MNHRSWFVASFSAVSSSSYRFAITSSSCLKAEIRSSFAFQHAHHLREVVQLGSCQVLGACVGWVLGAQYFAELQLLALGDLLHPELADSDMPKFSVSLPL